MNADKMMDAIGGISNKHIEEFAVIKPVKQDRFNRLISMNRKLIYQLSACLVVIAIVLGVGIPAIRNNRINSSLNMSVYALSDDGTVTEQKMTESIQLPVSFLETNDGLTGILFSVNSAYKQDSAKIAIYGTGDYEEKTAELIEIVGVNLKPDKLYFFVIGQSIEELENVSFSYFDEETGSKFEIVVQVTKSYDGYYAELKQLNSFPTKIH